MNSSRTGVRLLALAAVAGLMSAPARAEDFKTEPGFVRLDDGKSLEGWTGNLQGWSIQDGAIHLDVKKARGNIYWKATHSRDCVIRLQFRATRGADSGVFIHGNQLQVRDYPNAGPKEYAAPARPAGRWNDLEFDITGGVAVVRLNGAVIEKAWRIGNNPRQGIGLQREVGNFDFRYLRIKEKK
ncbi:MAG: DUF1080 domain-containing protein [Planctomycetes bacterium]|nr:DUF1080 domain-containing protein [Planctomycetota bacterium]